MKKTLLTLALVCASAAAFAQGKVSLQLDLPVTFGPASGMLAADLGFANQIIPNNGTTLPSHIYLSVGLYAGTASGSLTLQSSVVLNPPGGNGTPDGFFPLTHVVLSFAGGSLAYYQVKIWDSTYASYEAQAAAGHVGNGTDYSAFNNIFTMTAGTGIAYPAIINGGGTTWVSAGNENVNALLIVSQVPEPATFALAGLAAAGLLIFRRRK